MIDSYPDTSFLFRLYENDAVTLKALQYVRDLPSPLPITPLLRFEFMQAVRLLMFQEDRGVKRGWTRKRGAAILNQFSIDIRKLYAPAPIDLQKVLEIAEELSARYTREHGYRAMDILHVATALHLGAKAFLSFDKSQRMLASAEGLELPL